MGLKENRKRTKKFLENFQIFIDKSFLYRFDELSFTETFNFNRFETLLHPTNRADEKDVLAIQKILKYANNLSGTESSIFYYHYIKGYSLCSLRAGVIINGEEVLISNAYILDKKLLDKFYYPLHAIIPYIEETEGGSSYVY